MVADPRRLTRFFFDRNLGHRVPEALRADGWLVELHDDHFAEDTPDGDILEAVAQAGWVLVTQDRRIRKRAEMIEVLRRAHDAMTVAVDELDSPFVVAIYKNANTRRII